MILTEAELAPYRDHNGHVHIVTRPSAFPAIKAEHPALPHEFFTLAQRGIPFTRMSDVGHPDLWLAVVFAFFSSAPPLRSERTWIGLQQQAGGHFCEQHRLIATVLPPHPGVRSALCAIARWGHHKEGGWFGRSNLKASHIQHYASALSDISLHCESSWRLLTESIYPIDATEENLKRIAIDAPSIAMLCDWEEPPFFGWRQPYLGSDPVILLLTENSD